MGALSPVPRDFTVKQVEKLRHVPPKLTLVRRNLYLDTRDGASWSFRYMLDGRPRDMGLGAYDLDSLDEVDDEARRLRRLVREGRDPIAERRAERLDRGRLPLIASMEAYVERRRSAPRNQGGPPACRHRPQIPPHESGNQPKHVNPSPAEPSTSEGLSFS